MNNALYNIGKKQGVFGTRLYEYFVNTDYSPALQIYDANRVIIFQIAKSISLQKWHLR
jgi:hypothetical protein